MRKKQKQAEMQAPPFEQRRITPVDIQQKEFRLAMRGYSERDVDQFLDEVTEEVARLYADNKRLREEVEFGRTSRLEATGAAEADAIIRQAREEAARIIAEATARASTIGDTGSSLHSSQPGGGPVSGSGAPPSEIMGIFLARERAFLQNMANLIQAHAEGVKLDVRRVREQVARPAPEEEAPTSPAEARTDMPAGAQAPVESDRGEPAVETPAATRTATDEPTQAWDDVPATAEPEGEPPQQDIVDLTQEREGSADDAPDSGRGPGGTEGALSNVYGGTAPSVEAEDASRRPGEARPRAGSAPRVEDDDPREERSIRELFWGED
jgi:DivIVA domain-containing protein